MKVFKLMSLCMLIMYALCFQGPRTKVNLILRNSNLKQTKLMLTYWIYTDGKSQVVLYTNTEIEIKDLPEGAKVSYASVFAENIANHYDFDFALCTKVFNSTQPDVLPTINDYYVEKFDLLNLTDDSVGQKFPQVLQNSLDTMLDARGTEDWVYEGQSQFPPNITLVNETFWDYKNLTDNWKTGCPMYRILNTYDYQDFKFEIYKSYEVFGIIFVQLKDWDPKKPNETYYLDMNYTLAGNLTTITLLDQASQIAVAVIAIALGTLIII